MNKIFVFIGIFLGALLSIVDSMIAFSDTASLDNEFGLEIISWPFFISKVLIYSAIGGLIGFIINSPYAKKHISNSIMQL
jgi:hypothetical protein